MGRWRGRGGGDQEEEEKQQQRMKIPKKKKRFVLWFLFGMTDGPGSGGGTPEIN